MKIKELIKALENFNPEKEIKYRYYGNRKDGFVDLSIYDVRVDREKIVMATQCGVL